MLFLGVCLNSQTYDAMPKLRRGKKFDWLYEEAVKHKIIYRMEGLSKQEQIEWHGRFDRESDHELRARYCLFVNCSVSRKRTLFWLSEMRLVDGSFYLLCRLGQNWAKETLKDNIKMINASEVQKVQVINKSGF